MIKRQVEYHPVQSLEVQARLEAEAPRLFILIGSAEGVRFWLNTGTDTFYREWVGTSVWERGEVTS